METLKTSLLFVSLLIVFGHCQQDLDIANVQPTQTGPGYKTPPTENPRIIPPEVIKKEFQYATGWRIIWEDNNFENDTWKKYPGIFSTINGTVHSVNYLNNTSWQNTDNADMFLLFENITSTNRPELTYQAYVKATQFRRSDMTVADLENYAVNNPAMFKYLFENEPYLISEVQPAYPEEGDYFFYQNGNFFTFRTDRNPAKYGAVRIVKALNPVIIEVVVQKDGIGGLIPG